MCRFTSPAAQPRGHVADDYSPPPDLGFVWLREAGGMWAASGMVHRSVFPDPAVLDRLLERVSRDVVGRDEQFASCVAFVTAAETEQRGRGGWAQVRWERGWSDEPYP